MTADALVHHPTYTHLLKYFATTGKHLHSQTSWGSPAQSQLAKEGDGKEIREFPKTRGKDQSTNHILS